MDLLDRVVYRYLKQAAAIGDPQELLQRYDHTLKVLSELEPLIPKMREAQKIVDANGGYSEAEHKAHTFQLAPHENELLNTVYYRNIMRFKVWVSLDPLKRVNAWSLFLAILQQYELPPATRKTIETAAKFLAKSRLKAPSRDEAVEAYENFLKTLRSFSMAAHDALAHGKPRAGDAGAEGQELTPEKFHAGPFTIVNTGGFNDAVLAACTKVVEVAAHQLQSHGLGRVCYGDVLISNTLMKANVLAFYLIEKDELFVRANLKGKESAAIETVTHELGHRLMYKFLTGKHREIEAIYKQIAGKGAAARSEAIDRIWTDPHLKPKIGDTLIAKGEEFVVSGFDVDPRRGIVVQLVAKDSPSPGVTHKAKITLEGYAAMKGILPKEVHHSGFVTAYAGTSASENFAEMVAHYCTGKLPEDQVAMLESVL